MSSQHLHWIVLNDRSSARVAGDDVDPAEEAAVIDRVLIPLTNSELAHVRGRSGAYTATGEVSGKYALVRLLDEDAPIADIGICLHNRAAGGLWRRLLSTGIDADGLDRPPQTPWCAVVCYAPESALPPWFDSWTKTLGMALVRREGW